MVNILRMGWLLILLCLLTACRQSRSSAVKPDGLGLAELPVAVNPQVFSPADGRYAELVLRGDRWHAFIDELPAGTMVGEDQLMEFGKNLRQGMEAEGRGTVLLISADGPAPMSSLLGVIRGVAGSGISQFDLQVRSRDGAANHASVHSVKLDLGCMHCGLSGRGSMNTPLEVVIARDGSIQERGDDSQATLDHQSVLNELPGLDAKVSAYAARAREQKSAPWVKVMLDDAVSYQRFLDVLKLLEVHGVVYDFTTPDHEDKKDVSDPISPILSDPSLRPLPTPPE